MTQAAMYPAKAGSKRTTITADIDAAARRVQVADLSVFPVAPNLSTLQSDANVWETCLYTAKSAESGRGYLTITRSGEGHASSSGGALSWSSGAMISRNPCGLDHDRFKANIEDLVATTQPLDATLTTLSGLTNPAIRDLIGSASSTTGPITIYVWSGATGTGDGTSKANAFTSPQAAVDSLPAIINHTVTIVMCAGTAPYDSNILLKRSIAAGTIEIRGEYYWYGTVAATKTGKITLGASDFGYAGRANINAGDKVMLIKWSGAVKASTPVAAYIDTVASVSGTEITLTTNTSLSVDNTFSYVIVKTSMVTTGVSFMSMSTSFTLSGLNLHSNTDRCVRADGPQLSYINYCNITSNGTYGMGLTSRASITSNSTYVNAPAAGVSATIISMARCDYCVISGETAGVSVMVSSTGFVYKSVVMNATTGLTCLSSSFCHQSGNLISATTPKFPVDWASSTDGSFVS